MIGGDSLFFNQSLRLVLNPAKLPESLILYLWVWNFTSPLLEPKKNRLAEGCTSKLWCSPRGKENST